MAQRRAPREQLLRGALPEPRQLDKVTKLLNALAGSPNREVKQFAIERSRAVAQYLQQQQQQLAGAARK